MMMNEIGIWNTEETNKLVEFNDTYSNAVPQAVEETEEEEQRWRITNDQEAEWLIDKTRDKQTEIARYRMALESKILLLKDKLEKLNREEESAIGWRDSMLLEYFETIGDELKKATKTQIKYRLPSGNIIKKFPSPEYKKDNDTLLDWAKGNNLSEYIETKESVKWSELKKETQLVGNTLVYKATGEVVEGVWTVEKAPTVEFKED